VTEGEQPHTAISLDLLGVQPMYAVNIVTIYSACSNVDIL